MNSTNLSSLCSQGARCLGALSIGLYAGKELIGTPRSFLPIRAVFITSLSLAALPTITKGIVSTAQSVYNWGTKNPRKAIALATTTVAVGASYYLYPE